MDFMLGAASQNGHALLELLLTPSDMLEIGLRQPSLSLGGTWLARRPSVGNVLGAFQAMGGWKGGKGEEGCLVFLLGCMSVNLL